MNAHNPAWFAGAEVTELSSYANWSRRHPLLTADEERRLLQQHQEAAWQILSRTSSIGGDWWSKRYPTLDWSKSNWIAVVWEKRPTYSDMKAAVQWNRQQAQGVDLEAAWQDLNAARTVLLGSNVRLVFSVAYKHTRQGLDLMDLVQEGHLGLMRALEKFDVAQGTRFSTYSHHWIKQYIRLALKNQASLVRKPTNVVDDLKRFQRQLVQAQQRHGKPLAPGAIGRELGMVESDVRRFLEIGQTPLSLDAQLADEGSEYWIDMLADDAPEPDEVSAQMEQSQQVRASLSMLGPRERTIVAMRYGIGHGQDYGYREIAEQLGISRERVRQLEKEALGTLKRHWPQDLIFQ